MATGELLLLGPVLLQDGIVSDVKSLIVSLHYKMELKAGKAE